MSPFDRGDLRAPPVVGTCSALAAPGVWEPITPAPVLAGFNGADSGLFAFAVDPVNLGTVYLGTVREGLWKTTDCGSTWSDIGKSTPGLDEGLNWTLAVDPVDPRVVYTNSGYGKDTNALFKSTNAGVDWSPIWPPSDPALSSIVQYNFANVVAMDPADHQHLLLTFHATCNAPYNQTCIAETHDAGATWRLINGEASWVGTEGQIVYFLDDAQTWLWGSQSNGLWRTADGGQSWSAVPDNTALAHLQGAQLHRTKDGVYYLAAANGVLRSPDGISWTTVDGTGPLAGGLVSDGTTMYLSTFYGREGSDLHPYFSTAESDGIHWAPMTSPGMTEGGTLGYDPAHRLLYSSNLHGGFWRVVLP
jgi:hypothetical protein